MSFMEQAAGNFANALFSQFDPNAKLMNRMISASFVGKDTALDHHIEKADCQVCRDAAANGTDNLCKRGARADKLDALVQGTA